MSLLSFLFDRKTSARQARQRLSALIEQERAPRCPDFLPTLQRELAKVASSYAMVPSREIKMRVRARRDSQVLEVRIPLREPVRETR